jgi:hypothetical protein
MIIHLSYSLDEVPPKFNFYFFATSQFDWPITQKKLETMEAHQHRRFYFEVQSVPPSWDPDAWVALHFFWS